MNKPPDDYYDDNEVAMQIIVELSKLYDTEDEWVEILIISIAKIIFNSYHTHQHEEVINNIAKVLRNTMRNVRIYEE